MSAMSTARTRVSGEARNDPAVCHGWNVTSGSLASFMRNKRAGAPVFRKRLRWRTRNPMIDAQQRPTCFQVCHSETARRMKEPPPAEPFLHEPRLPRAFGTFWVSFGIAQDVV